MKLISLMTFLFSSYASATCFVQDEALALSREMVKTKDISQIEKLGEYVDKWDDPDSLATDGCFSKPHLSWGTDVGVETEELIKQYNRFREFLDNWLFITENALANNAYDFSRKGLEEKKFPFTFRKNKKAMDVLGINLKELGFKSQIMKVVYAPRIALEALKKAHKVQKIEVYGKETTIEDEQARVRFAFELQISLLVARSSFNINTEYWQHNKINIKELVSLATKKNSELESNGKTASDAIEIFETHGPKHPISFCYLGMFYQKSEVIDKDEKKAYEYFKKGASSFDSCSMFQIVMSDYAQTHHPDDVIKYNIVSMVLNYQDNLRWFFNRYSLDNENKLETSKVLYQRPMLKIVKQHLD